MAGTGSAQEILLAQCQGDALVSGPVHRALGVLTEQKHQLGDSIEDRIRREAIRELQDRILAELAADRGPRGAHQHVGLPA